MNTRGRYIAIEWQSLMTTLVTARLNEFMIPTHVVDVTFVPEVKVFEIQP